MGPDNDKARKSKLHKAIKNTPLFAEFSDEELIDLERVITDKRFSKNEVVLLEEDSSNYMYVVCSGKVKAVQTSVDGKEHILAVRGKGDFFGEMGILDGKTSPATVIAIEDAEIGLIAKDDFERYLLTDQRFLRQIILLLCSRLRESWLTLKVLSLSEAESRVRAMLKLISDQYGIKDQRGILISLKLTHKDISRYVSLSRETVTRQLDRLSKGDEIEILENKHILLKPAFFEKPLFW
jgi:CRP/FNR family cyclic AMP-dependent transcriptional regulator